MTLRAKAVLILAAAFVGILAVMYVTASQVLLRTFARIESDGVQRSMQAVLEALDAESESVDAVAARWADGDPPAAAGSEIDFVALVGGAGRVALVAGKDAATERAAALASELGGAIDRSSALVRHAHTESVRTGLLALSRGTAVGVCYTHLTLPTN